MKKIRCAVYTRKSSEEGLDQNFNSLDAQREACEAYIASQKHEGWHCLRDRFDDGAYSGGNMVRPALTEILERVANNQVDIIVVYKVDRLTRSLVDFARMVEIFDEEGVSFVSVTQQFNTTDSMGRLTLNVLLSFAQFEREVTAERIRDKIAASKKKGMWMGGTVPLGYDALDRKLRINPQGAETVRTLFDLFLEHGSVRKVKEHADLLDLRSKARGNNIAMPAGNNLFTRGHLYYLLSNPVYTGKIRHKGIIYDGEQPAIISWYKWGEVQELLAKNTVARRSGKTFREPSLLAGLLFDGSGRRLTPSHAKKAHKRYRYYINQADPKTGELPTDPLRIPAPTLEKAVVKAIIQMLGDQTHVLAMGQRCGLANTQIGEFCSKVKETRDAFAAALPNQGRAILLSLVDKIVLGIDTIQIHIKLINFLDDDVLRLHESGGGELHDAHALELPMFFRRRGVETKVVIGCFGSQSINSPDPFLIELVANAWSWMDALRGSKAKSIVELAKKSGVHRADLSKALPLAFLAPDIVEKILSGNQPIELTAKKLRRMGKLPIDGQEQRERLAIL